MDMQKVIQSVVTRKRSAFTQSPLGEFAVLGALLVGTQVGMSNLSHDASRTLPISIANSQASLSSSVESLTPAVPAAKITQLNAAQVDSMVDLINHSAPLPESEMIAQVGINPSSLNQADIAHNDSVARFVFAPATNTSVDATLANSSKTNTKTTIVSTAPNKQYQFIPSSEPKLGHSAKSNLFQANSLSDTTLAVWSINKKFSLAGKRQKIAAIEKRKQNDKFVIMLDPGHGGTDPGSVGHNGLEEKELTLEIAKRAALFLSEVDGIEVVLTRDSDTGMSRKNRVHKVKRSNADMVVSLHLNHLPQTDVNLVETFYAAPHNILESIEKQQAEENSNGLLKTSSHNHDLSFTKGSRQLANIMQKRVFDEVAHENPDTDNAGVKEDMLYILTRSFTPGVLIEMSCLSNVQEAKRLADPAYRDRLAAALADGIRDYLNTPEAKRQYGPGV